MVSSPDREQIHGDVTQPTAAVTADHRLSESGRAQSMDLGNRRVLQFFGFEKSRSLQNPFSVFFTDSNQRKTETLTLLSG